MRVFATRALPGRALEHLAGEVRLEVWPGAGTPPRAELLRRAAKLDGLLCTLSDGVDADCIAAAPSLRAISSCSVGTDHVDLAAASARGIPVGHTPGVLAETTADLAFALLMAAARRLVEADRFVREGAWRDWQPGLLLGRDVHGATLGVIGIGAVGQAVARRAAGFGMKVLGWSRSGRRIGGIETVELADLLRRSDFVSLHVALAPETRGLIGRAELGLLRPGAVLVNTARGGLVDEAALAESLTGGRLAAAALDVFEREPLPHDDPLLAAPNLVLAPHIGSASVATRVRMAELSVQNLLAGLRGEPLPHCANPEFAKFAKPVRR